MNKFRILLASLFLLASTVSSGQTVVAGISTTTLPCGGGSVNLTALGNSTVPVFGDDFNTGGVAPGWSATAAAQFNNPCGPPPVGGGTYLWMGPGTAAPREMTTAPVDVSCGGQVCFDFKFMPEGAGTQSSPCEGADLFNEGVSLQYSVNGGATWIDFAYFAPNGTLLTSYPGGQTSPYASGNNAFTSWNNYCFPIPAGAFSPTTMFQLHQWGSSGTGFDHWGIDNFFVYATPCAPFVYDWAHIPGAPDAPNVSTNVTQTTTFTVCYTNIPNGGTQSVCDNVTVTVQTIDITSVVTGIEPCLGDNAGTVNITSSGGTAPITYTIAGPTPSSNGTGNFTGLAPGNYTVTVTDNGSCVATQNFTITPGPACCTVTATSVDALCFGGATGTATANPANGVAPYTYQWNAAAGNQTTQTANNLAAGNYSVTITDFNGCQSTVPVVVGQPAVLNTNATPTDITCFGLCNGQIVVAAPTGGIAPYQYSINGGALGASGTFTGLCAANYNLIAQDANGCQVVMSNIPIAQPTDVTLVQQSTTPATCGASNGALTVLAGGGTLPYQYNIGGANQASATFNGLAAGAYNVTVTDANGCTEVVVVNVANSAGPVPFVDTQSGVTCAGGLNGSVTIGVGGGTGPYLFSLDGGPNQASNTFAVSAGPHTVLVTDANGCSGSIPFNIAQPTALTYATVVVPASCNGVCDGTVTIAAANATPPYQYSSNNGLTFGASNVLTGLCAGNVNVVVKDANGCLANSVEPIAEPPVLTSGSSFVEPSCHGLSDGTISFTPAGGTPGYTFSVDNGTTFTAPNPQTGIAAGTYDIAVQDANGCQFTDQIIVTEPPAFNFLFIANNPSNCGASDGSFEIIATNGQAPYTYSIDGGVTSQFNNGFFLNLFSGLYQLVCTDINGCSDSIYSALSDNIMTTAIDVIVPTTCKGSCDGLAIISQQFGAAPFSYTINTGGTQGGGVFGNLCAGQHFVTVQDAGLCLGIQEVIILEPDSVEYTPTLTHVTCPGGTDGIIDFGAVTGGTGGPYTYSIDGGTTFQAGAVFNGLPIGPYDCVAMDANGCIGTVTVTLTEPPAWNVVVNANDLTCFQNNTGFIQIVGGGSTAPYTYDLSGTPSATGIYAGIAAANYNITVTDVNLCTFTTTQLINEPALLTAAYTLNDALCNGAADGSIDVVAAGGTPAYAYSSDNGVITQSGSSLTGLTAGCYDVYVKDINNCTVVSNECIGEPSQLTMTMVMNPATCGINNADVTITALNGTPGYTYSNDNGASFQPGNSFNGLAPINYNIVVEDLNGCQIDSLITLAADALPTIDNVVSNDPLCFGSLDGDITITSSGGVGVHQYSINGGALQASNVFNGLGDGVYDIDVVDANGCISTTQITLTQPAQLTLAGVPTPLLCNNDFTGAISLTEGGGTAPYQYSIDFGATFQAGGLFSFIGAALYDCQVVDANGCIADVQVDVTEPNVLEFVAFTSTDPTCFNACDGTISTTPSGGTLPYTYNWSGNIAGAADQNASQATSPSGLVCPDNYTVTITDANGCQYSDNTTLLDPPALIIPGLTVTDVDCFANATGDITVTVPTNGVAPYSYSLAGGAFVASNQFPGLVAGNYDVDVMDANGCLAQTNTTIYEPDAIVATLPPDGIVCYNADVTIQTFVLGGVMPYAFNWTNNVNGNNPTTQVFTDPITAPISYSVVITDANGCVLNVVDTYDLSPLAPLTVNAGPDQFICLGQSATFTAVPAGGEMIDFGAYIDYGYSWDTGIAVDTFATVTVSPVVQTNYIISVTDNCGDTATDTVMVGIHPDPVVLVPTGLEGCVPSTIGFDPGLVPAGYTVFWDYGNGQTSSSLTVDSAYYDAAGTYDVTLTIVTDNGCTISVTEPMAVTIHDNPTPGFYVNPNSPSILDPTLSVVNTSVGGETYYYTFDGYGTSSEEEPTITLPIDEEATITVCQTIVSADNCPASICVPVDIHEEILFYIPNVFTPDGDLFNEGFSPVFTSGIDIFDFHMTIFNRWGEIIFESYNKEKGWDGHYGDGGLVKDGTYIWQVEFGEKLSDKKQTHRGHVTVLK